MEELILSLLVTLNFLFARVCGWMEGTMDDKYYFTETIAGRKKHFTYMILRGCFYVIICLVLSLIWQGWELALVLGLVIPALLLQFRFEHDGEYHVTRNKLNPKVSPDGFKQDDDGLSGSLFDRVVGFNTYQGRLLALLISLVLFLLTIIILRCNLF